MVRLDRVMAPKQVRSTESLQRIVQALETLLNQKSFAEISMSEIEAQSKCGIATIYARFRDKKSILAALHESIRDRLIEQIDERMGADRWFGHPLEQASLTICTDLVKFYSKHRNLLRAVMLLDDAEVYERVAASIRHASNRLRSFITDDKMNDDVLDRRVDLGTMAIYALLQQRLIFQSISPGQYSRTDKEFAADLALLLRLCAGSAE